MGALDQFSSGAKKHEVNCSSSRSCGGQGEKVGPGLAPMRVLPVFFTKLKSFSSCCRNIEISQ